MVLYSIESSVLLDSNWLNPLQLMYVWCMYCKLINFLVTVTFLLVTVTVTMNFVKRYPDGTLTQFVRLPSARLGETVTVPDSQACGLETGKMSECDWHSFAWVRRTITIYFSLLICRMLWNSGFLHTIINFLIISGEHREIYLVTNWNL